MIQRNLIAAFLGLIVLGVGAFTLQSLQERDRVDVAITDARLVFLNEERTKAVILAQIETAGSPERLTGVVAEIGSASLGGARANIPATIPSQTKAMLSSDGTAVFLSDITNPPDPGQLVPITLYFSDRPVVFRARTGAVDPKLEHAHHGVSFVLSKNNISLSVAIEPGNTDTRLKLAVAGLNFVQTEDGTAHVDGEGHGHIYVNGLKLGRIYGDEYQFGPLPGGTHKLTLTLNAHDHRPYKFNGSETSLEIFVER